LSQLKTEFQSGVKTFFIVPELSLFPEEYLKSYFLKGFETYIIDDDPYCLLEAKIHVIFSLFSEVILFFNIDRQIHGIEWSSFIARLQQTYQERAMIGIMYRKKNNLEETKPLERLYLYDIGINGGCIPIEYQKSKNLYLFLNVLIANQANGQRKYLRSICDESYKMNFIFQKNQYQCTIRDLSISHFSCVFRGEVPEIPLHEKITDIQMNLKGVLIKVDGVFSLMRNIGEDAIHVFVFRNSDGKDGLTTENMLRVNDIIHNSFQTSMSLLLRHDFDAVRTRIVKEKRERIIPDILACARDVVENPDSEKSLALTSDK